MRCERAQELFSEYCEGTVQAALKVSLESHLATCDRCRDGVGGLRHVWKVLDAAPVVAAPDGFRAAVWQRIDSQESAGAGLHWAQRFLADWKGAFGRRPLVWAAAAVLLLAFAGFAVPGRYSPAGWLVGLIKGDSRTQFVAAKPQIGAGGQIMVPLYLTNGENKVYTGTVPIRVRVLDGPVSLALESTSLTYDGRNAVMVQFTATPDAPSAPIVLEATRLDGGQPSTQILTIPIPKQ